MATNSTIEWTDATWNPVRGCSVISPGCVNCYAMKQGHRFSGAGRPYEGLTKQTKAGPQWTGKVMLVENHLLDPLKWRAPKRVFVNSMADLFHESVPDELIDRIFAVMALAKQHTFQILTKRAGRMAEYMSMCSREQAVNGAIWSALGTRRGSKIKHGGNWRCQWPLPNVWLGVSCENQKYADERIPHLLQTPAAIRFVSAEPLLGAINLRKLTTPYYETAGGVGREVYPLDGLFAIPDCDWDVPKLDWVIVGGESGHGSRPFDIAWARSIVKQCADAKVACFVKQLGANPITDGDAAHPGKFQLDQADSKGSDIDEWPADLRVREYPLVAA